jgi:hypothetical protein
LGDRITYIGLDVHKDGIVVAVAEGGLRDEVRGAGTAPRASAALGVSVAPRLPLWAPGMDQGAPPLACGSAV